MLMMVIKQPFSVVILIIICLFTSVIFSSNYFPEKAFYKRDSYYYDNQKDYVTYTKKRQNYIFLQYFIMRLNDSVEFF